MSEPIQIPNKSLFKMNEVCGLTGVKPYVLRFWESEFEEISPLTSSTGQKLYEHKDIEAIALIKKMLFEEKMSIEQAKAEISMRMAPVEELPDLPEEAYGEEETHIEPHREEVVISALNDNDIQKLVVAKERLNDLLSFANSIQERHNWQ